MNPYLTQSLVIGLASCPPDDRRRRKISCVQFSIQKWGSTNFKGYFINLISSKKSQNQSFSQKKLQIQSPDCPPTSLTVGSLRIICRRGEKHTAYSHFLSCHSLSLQWNPHICLDLILSHRIDLLVRAGLYVASEQYFGTEELVSLQMSSWWNSSLFLKQSYQAYWYVANTVSGKNMNH